MSDRIVVMNGGIAEQVGTPFEIYNRPTTKFVANFVGTLNVFDAQVENSATGAVRIGATVAQLGRGLTAARGETITLALRPEAVHLSTAEGRDLALDATIQAVEFMGSVIRIKADVAGQSVSLDTFNRTDTPPPPVGAQVKINVNPREFIQLGG